MKILEIVKVNNGFGFVVDEAAPLVYREEFVFDQAFKRTEHMLIGESPDGRMDFLVHHNYGSMKAFAGREPRIQMEDGTQRTIKDVWWSEGSSAWAAEHDVELHGFSYGTLDGMIDCCVFYASIMRAERLQELINEFYETHPNYTPWDHDAWHEHCHKLHEEQYLICPKCHASVHQDKAPYGKCPQMLQQDDHSRRTLQAAHRRRKKGEELMPFKCMRCGCVADTMTRPVSCRICGGKMLSPDEYLQYAGSKTAVAFTLATHGGGGIDSRLPTIQPISNTQWLDDVSETAAWNMDEVDALVDREAFVHNLGVLLSQTREDVVKCELIDRGDTVVITFKGGGTRTVNVHADSYAAIIRDVMKQV